MDEKLQLIYMRGVIVSMPKEDQLKIEIAKEAIQKTIKEHGGLEGHGGIALALIGAEEAAK